MNEMTVSPTVAALAIVPPREVSYLDIRRDQATYPRITSVPREVAVAALQQMIWRASFNAAPGTFSDRDQAERLAAMAAELYDLLLEDYNGVGTDKVSFAELARIIRRASVSRDTYGINCRSLLVAVEDYCTGEGQKASRQLQAEIWKHRTLTHHAAPAQEVSDTQTAAAMVAIDRLTAKMKTK